MSQRICDVEGCERKHVARGQCAYHWKRLYGTRTKYPITCSTCGKAWQSDRPTGRFCSDRCKGLAYSIEKRPAGRELVHVGPAHLVPPPPQPPRAEPKPTRKPYLFYSGPCTWCGETFTDWQPRASHCSRRCSKKHGKTRRRAREFGATGSYTWAEVTRKWIDNGKVCHYCHVETSLALIEPDHVVPLSKGGSNSIVNVVPCCRPCNSDKRDLLLDQWPSDRQRRGLPALAYTTCDVVAA